MQNLDNNITEVKQVMSLFSTYMGDHFRVSGTISN